ncbi:Winged helix-turn-helix DNA-binding [Halovenus aranensis]|jgi:predicted transcriptional regulator|uniref:Winged helix-turn-helix DNA-binding n=1 Tax=Halovenus aranensis TaxID=890420 RepID=A0A1G8YQJ3_9EURY|nr:Winged helix-turn-helix DNA-binding [Halovenus aranensis]
MYTLPYIELGERSVSETRSRIRDCIHRNPGIHFNAISRKLDIATGQTQYHLRKLFRREDIQRESICGKTHYYPPTYSEWERGAIALLRRESTREVVLLLLERERVAPADIADRLGTARSTVEWHLSNLVEHDVVRKTETDDGLVVELTDSSTTYRLLREVEPRFSDRLIDRFSRLADELLAE